MEMTPPASRFLSDLGIPHQVFVHSGSVKSLEQAAQERGQTPDQVVRSILFREGEGRFVMVLMAGEQQVSWQALRSYLNVSRISMASEQEVFESTGYQVGAVSPFGLPAPLRILCDEHIFGQDEVSLGSGKRGTAIIIHTADLRRALGKVEIVNLGNRR